MLATSLLLFVFSSAVHASHFQPCPLLGAAFQQPYNLSTDVTFQDVVRNLINALQDAVVHGRASSIAIESNISSFSIGVFDLNGSLFSFQHTAETSTLDPNSIKQVDRNSIYRIASISKLFTVYLYLIETGWKYWDRAVTDFLPHLAELESRCNPDIDPLDCIAWSDITVGSLASHMAGLPRDYGTANITGGRPPYALGLPPSNLTASEITCQERFACQELPFLDGVSIQHPTDAVYAQPIYSNAGFQILGYIFENITGKPFSTALDEQILQPLGMRSTTTYQPSNPANAIIPGNATSSLWNYRAGPQSVPWLGLYSTQADLETAGRSILNSTLISPRLTRRWLKPASHTGSGAVSVGMPWEILRSPLGSGRGRVVDQYTKSGDIGAYHSRLALLPDYGVGYVVLLAGAGDGGFLAVEGLVDTVSRVLLPGLEAAARAQAAAGMAGTYRAAAAPPDAGDAESSSSSGSSSRLNSSMTLVTDPDLPGLRVASWISNGTDFLAFNAALWGEKLTDVRLYPTQLQKTTSSGSVLRTYRAVTSFPGIHYAGETMRLQNCDSWVNVDGAPYNEISLDEVVIETVDGRAVSVSPRALDVVLSKV